jgi:hypothetical protein
MYRGGVNPACALFSSVKTLFSVRFVHAFFTTQSAVDNCVSLDLDEHFGIDKIDENHRGGRLHCAEDFSVRAPHVLPHCRVPNEHACTHYVFSTSARLLQCGHYDFDAAARLQIGIPWCYNAAILSNGRGAGYADVIADAHGA